MNSMNSIPIDATCMVCGKYRLSVRVRDIGWICLDCVDDMAHMADGLANDEIRKGEKVNG